MQDEKAAKKSPSGDGPVYAKESALKDAEDGAVQVSTVDQNSGIYDPSKESRMTRLGLTAESFKRAPGLTTTHVGGCGHLRYAITLQPLVANTLSFQLMALQIWRPLCRCRVSRMTRRSKGWIRATADATCVHRCCSANANA